MVYAMAFSPSIALRGTIFQLLTDKLIGCFNRRRAAAILKKTRRRTNDSKPISNALDLVLFSIIDAAVQYLGFNTPGAQHIVMMLAHFLNTLPPLHPHVNLIIAHLLP
ncbi:MAG: hypothetical protein CUN55_21045, partial [Phototrophicales bacterium]